MSTPRCSYCDHVEEDHSEHGCRYECRCEGWNYDEGLIEDTCRDCGHTATHSDWGHAQCSDPDCECPGWNHLPLITCAKPPAMLEQERKAHMRTWGGRLYEEAMRAPLRYRQFIEEGG